MMNRAERTITASAHSVCHSASTVHYAFTNAACFGALRFYFYSYYFASMPPSER